MDKVGKAAETQTYNYIHMLLIRIVEKKGAPGLYLDY